MTVPDPATGGQLATDDEVGRWREAARLRREHPGWIVLWLARIGQYRAYPLVLARHRATLTAGAPGASAAQVSQAEQAPGRPPPARRARSAT